MCYLLAVCLSSAIIEACFDFFTLDTFLSFDPKDPQSLESSAEPGTVSALLLPAAVS